MHSRKIRACTEPRPVAARWGEGPLVYCIFMEFQHGQRGPSNSMGVFLCTLLAQGFTGVYKNRDHSQTRTPALC